MPTIQIKSPEQFIEIIPTILSDLADRNTLLLHGPLGAGKTTFTQYLGRYLKVGQPIVSPTFTYIREYILADKQHFYHLDMYKFVGDLEEILWPEIQREARLIVVEWPEKVPEVYDLPHLALHFAYHDQNTRTLTW